MDTSPQGRLIALGEIAGTHGVRGLLRLHPANPASAASVVAAATRTVYLRTPARAPASQSEARPVVLASARPHGRMVLLAIAGVDDVARAEELIGLELAVREDELPPPAAGEYYAYQLEGLEVVTVDGARLGTVTSLFPTGSNDVLVVRDGEREHLIPVVADIVHAVDLAAGRITIVPIAGLLEDV